MNSNSKDVTVYNLLTASRKPNAQSTVELKCTREQMQFDNTSNEFEKILQERKKGKGTDLEILEG